MFAPSEAGATLTALCKSLDCLQGLRLKQKRGSSLGHMGLLSPPLPMLPRNECILSLSEMKLTLRACFQDQGFSPSAFATLSRLSQASLLRKPSGGHGINSQSMPREVSRGIHHLTSTRQSGASKATEQSTLSIPFKMGERMQGQGPLLVLGLEPSDSPVCSCQTRNNPGL